MQARDQAALRRVQCNPAPSRGAHSSAPGLPRRAQWRASAVFPQMRTKCIEDIAAGDAVWAWSFELDKPVPRTVRRLYRRVAQSLLRIAVRASDGSLDHILATTEHPFWVQGRGWTPASKLVTGARLQRMGTGEAPQVVNVEEAAAAPVFNFEVDRDHNYHVGHQGLLVHNTSHLQEARTVTPELRALLASKGLPSLPGLGAPPTASRGYDPQLLSSYRLEYEGSRVAPQYPASADRLPVDLADELEHPAPPALRPPDLLKLRAGTPTPVGHTGSTNVGYASPFGQPAFVAGQVPSTPSPPAFVPESLRLAMLRDSEQASPRQPPLSKEETLRRYQDAVQVALNTPGNFAARARVFEAQAAAIPNFIINSLDGTNGEKIFAGVGPVLVFSSGGAFRGSLPSLHKLGDGRYDVQFDQFTQLAGWVPEAPDGMM